MRQIPIHERCSLDHRSLDTSGHVDGIALRFGPGPDVCVMPPSIHSIALAMRWALEGLDLLNATLAKKDA